MKRALLVSLIIALYILHQDVWFWRTARPLVMGFIPAGLFYHACFTVAVAVSMWLLVKYAWPSHLESEIEGTPRTEAANPGHKENGSSGSEEGQAP